MGLLKSRVSILEGGTRLTILIPLCLCLTFVVQFLTLCESDLALDQISLEIEPGRNQRQPLLPDLREEARDLVFVEQQPALAVRIVILAVAVRVGADVDIDQPGFAVGDPD